MHRKEPIMQVKGKSLFLGIIAWLLNPFNRPFIPNPGLRIVKTGDEYHHTWGRGRKRMEVIAPYCIRNIRQFFERRKDSYVLPCLSHKELSGRYVYLTLGIGGEVDHFAVKFCPKCDPLPGNARLKAFKGGHFIAS
jgi:hypothetical protein